MDELRRELETLERRYGRSSAREELTKIETARARHQFELDRLNAELDRLLDLRRVVLESIDRLTALEQAVLRQCIDDERRAHREAWSPDPVLGFRAWEIRWDQLHGAAEAWITPTKEATCLTVSEVDEVPHTDGRCGVPACGIYALKHARDLARITGWDPKTTALGLVQLTGKVVEHTLGYRAQHVEILALTLPRHDGVLFALSPEDIQLVLDGDSRRLEAALPTGDQYETMCFWLEAQKEIRTPWISASKTA